MRPPYTPALAVTSLLLAVWVCSSAHADDHEHRFATASGSVFGSVKAGGVDSGPRLGYGFRLRYAYAPWNALEVGASVGASFAPNVELAEATLLDEMRVEHTGTLRTDVLVVDMAADARWIPHATGRWFPVLGLRVGALLRELRQQAFMDPSDGTVIRGAKATVLELTPLVGVEFGFERRIGRASVAGLVVGFSYAEDTYSAVGLNVEVSWRW